MGRLCVFAYILAGALDIGAGCKPRYTQPERDRQCRVFTFRVLITVEPDFAAALFAVFLRRRRISGEEGTNGFVCDGDGNAVVDHRSKKLPCSRVGQLPLVLEVRVAPGALNDLIV